MQPRRSISPFALLTLALALAVVAEAGCSATAPARAPDAHAEPSLDPKDPQFAERLVERYRQLEPAPSAR